jgi:hypothetical protein
MAVVSIIAALLFTGTVHAQTVLPGDNFYPWKRATEEVWRILSIDPVNIDITLSERRLNEWIAVADDPALSPDAMQGYFDELTRLSKIDNTKTRKIIAPVIQAHQEILNEAGLPEAEWVGNYLNQQIASVPFAPLATQVSSASIALPSQTSIPRPTATLQPPQLIVPTGTPLKQVDLIAPTVPPTEIPPTATPIVPTATPIEPTVTPVEPTATPVEPTVTPIEPTVPPIDPTATPVDPASILVDPTATPIAPTPTDVPVAPLEIIP